MNERTYMNHHLELVYDAHAVLGESPCWHAATQTLYWVDIIDKTLHCLNPATHEDISWKLPEQIGCVVPRKSGGLLLWLENGVAFFDPQTGMHEIVCNPEPDRTDTLPNDGKCDPAGRFWVGTKDAEERRPLGSLYCLDATLSLRKMESNITISNGLTWNPEFTVMYHIDSLTRQIVAYTYNLESGLISDRRIVINVPTTMGFPDGMTADREGMLWVAHWGGWQVARWNPNTGQLIASYDVPVSHTTSCCFGGTELTDLYITTARTRNSEQELQEQPHAGGIFRLQTEVQGFESFSFTG